MKKIIVFLIISIDLILLGLSNYTFMTNKEKYISNNIIANVSLDNITDYKNNYYRDINYTYVQNTNKNILNNKQDLLNIIYTMLNNGYDFYDFKCSNEYNCTSDLLTILNDNYTLNIINNLVSPYNSFKNLNLTYLPNGMLRLNITKTYTNEEISILNDKIDYIIKHIINDNMTTKDKIKQIHDYLANNIIYTSNLKDNTAYEALINGKAICTGYADIYSLFLDRLNIPNYKVVTNNHVWNVVKINNKWLHVDLTWDDPKNKNIINYDYFLITTKELKQKDLTEHNFNQNIYIELY